MAEQQTQEDDKHSAQLIIDVIAADPDDSNTCDFRLCRNPAQVIMRIREVDDGAEEVYCNPHAVVTANRALTRLWDRYYPGGSMHHV